MKSMVDIQCISTVTAALIAVSWLRVEGNNINILPTYTPRPLPGTSCPSSETIARAEQEIQEQLEILGSCEGSISLLEQEIALRRAGTSQELPATSCSQVRQIQPNADSGYYWIRPTPREVPVQAFCDMSRVCCGITSGGWLRVAYLDMTNASHQCPSQWREVNNPVRACVKDAPSGCASAFFDTLRVPYTQVCGRVIGYQYCTPNAFNDVNGTTIDDAYVDGVSITQGSPRQHVWTFAIAESDFPGQAPASSVCPCTVGQTQMSGEEVPSFVAQDYFCEAGVGNETQPSCDLDLGLGVYESDPVWDGQNCRQGASTCCQFNNPPWFCKFLDSSTNNLEVRLCADQEDDQDVLVELIELYVR